MKSSRVVIKLGGASLQNKETLGILAEAIAQYRKYGYQVLLVHGGGPAINSELQRRNISWRFHEGQRVTTPEMAEVIEMVLCSQINRQIVGTLEGAKVPSFGMACAAETPFLCKSFSPELDRVGAISSVRSDKLEKTLAWPLSPVPVLAPVGQDQAGLVYNINADWAACWLATKMQAKYLIYLTDQDGILDQNQNLITHVSVCDIDNLIQSEVVTGGMMTKVRSIAQALKNGVQGVRIMNAQAAVKGLWHDEVGTWCSESFPTELLWTADEYGEVAYAKA